MVGQAYTNWNHNHPALRLLLEVLFPMEYQVAESIGAWIYRMGGDHMWENIKYEFR